MSFYIPYKNEIKPDEESCSKFCSDLKKQYPNVYVQGYDYSHGDKNCYCSLSLPNDVCYNIEKPSVESCKATCESKSKKDKNVTPVYNKDVLIANNSCCCKVADSTAPSINQSIKKQPANEPHKTKPNKILLWILFSASIFVTIAFIIVLIYFQFKIVKKLQQVKQQPAAKSVFNIWKPKK